MFRNNLVLKAIVVLAGATFHSMLPKITGSWSYVMTALVALAVFLACLVIDAIRKELV